jgi:hypothetical protein
MKGAMLEKHKKVKANKKKKKETYYEYGKTIIGKEGSAAKRKKKTGEIYNELFPEG